LQLAPDFLAIEIGSYDAHLISLLKESLERIPQNALSLRAQLLARLSHALLWSRDSRDSEKLAIDALQLARRSGNDTSLNAALAARADSLTGPDRVQDRMRATNELLNTVREKDSLPDSVMQHVRLISALLEYGDIRAVDAAIASCERIATDMNVPQYLWYTKTFRAMRKLMEGDFHATHQLAKESHELGHKHGDENVLHSRACQTTCIFIEQNQATAALSTISAMASRRPLVRAWRAGTGYIHLMSQQPASAIRILESFDDSDVQLLFRETGGSAGVAFLAEIAAEAGDAERRSLLYNLCSMAPERSATLGFAIAYFGCFSRYAGLLAHKLGLQSEALEHLRNAIDIETKRGAILYRAHAALDLSHVLIETEQCADEVCELLSSVQTIEAKSAFHRISSRTRHLESKIASV
jgi:tetratricopeptide (TPR) repeat protein